LSKHNFLVVELRRPEKQRQLEAYNKKLQEQIAQLRRQIINLETLYGYEVYANGELIDLCRIHGIPFRPALDHAEKVKKGICID